MSKQPTTPRRRAQAGSNKIEIPVPMVGVPEELPVAEEQTITPEPLALTQVTEPVHRRFSIRGIFRPVASLVGWIVWLAARIAAGFVRMAVDIKKRQTVCRAVTDRAARAVAYSYTVRAVWFAGLVYCLWQAFFVGSNPHFWTGITLMFTWVFAEAVWAFVLYVAATISRLDDEVEKVHLTAAEAVATRRRQYQAATATTPAATTTE